jgi:hypothetical protein
VLPGTWYIHVILVSQIAGAEYFLATQDSSLEASSHNGRGLSCTLRTRTSAQPQSIAYSTILIREAIAQILNYMDAEIEALE